MGVNSIIIATFMGSEEYSEYELWNTPHSKCLDTLDIFKWIPPPPPQCFMSTVDGWRLCVSMELLAHYHYRNSLLDLVVDSLRW